MIGSYDQLIDSISVGGNTTFIAKQLKYFEEEILKKDIHKKYYDAPNYYAWLLMASEYIMYRIREILYFNFNDHSAFDTNYSRLLNNLFEEYEIGDVEIDEILFFVKVRHLLTHKGYPNPHTVPANKNYKLCKGYIFDKTEILKISQYLQDTKNYIEIKKKFNTVLRIIGRYEKPIKQDFGFMTIEKKRKE